jgi:hypothetical protein
MKTMVTKESHSLDGKSKVNYYILKGQKNLECNCGGQVFEVVPASFEDYEEGYVAICQECGQHIIISKE